jgi:hypothetical protein
MSNLDDGEGVGFLTLATTGSVRDDELGTIDIGGYLVVARRRVLLACPFRLARLCRGWIRWIRTLRWMWWMWQAWMTWWICWVWMTC